MSTSSSALALRAQLRLSQAEFARLVGADVRSVARWESARAKPAGGSRAVILALSYFLGKRPENEVNVRELLTQYARLGGLSYMLFDLIERMLTDGKTEKCIDQKKDA
jgi:transcriptional regulator with XRE-family HTH domain